MKIIVLYFSLLLYSVNSFQSSKEKDAEKYLTRFYDYDKSREHIEERIMKLQSILGIEKDGILSDEVVSYMDKARCGMADSDIRDKRYVRYGSKWDSGVTYKYYLHLNWMPLTMTEEQVRRAIKIGLGYWSKVANLDMIESLQPTGSSFSLSFASRDHLTYKITNNFQESKCYTALDNLPNGVLAHAFRPRSGNLHYDNAETWTEGTYDGINLRLVTAHEIGHAIGLSHSDDFEALMAPWYGGFIPEETFTLPRDDIDGIQSIYGGRRKRAQLQPNKRGEGKNKLLLCDTKSFHRVFRFSDDKIYVVADNSTVFRLDNNKVDETFEPTEINHEITNADSVFYDGKNKRLIILNGNRILSASGADITHLKVEELDISGRGAYLGKSSAVFARDISNEEEMRYFWVVEDNEVITGELLGNKISFGRRSRPLTDIITMSNGAKLPPSIDAAYLGGENDDLELYLFVGNSYYVGRPSGRRQVKYTVSAEYPRPYKSLLGC